MTENEIAGLIPAAAALAVERITYVVVWRHPDAFRQWCSRAGIGAPVDALCRLFFVFKVLQAGVFLAWFAWFGGWFTATPQPLLSSDVRAVALGLAMILVGQVLNVAVFRRLGRAGVFYGTRFGLKVPWVTGFPFSLLTHPQYVGTVLSIWGLFLLGRHPHPDWAVLPLLETLYYFVGAQLEADERTQPSSGSILSRRTKR
ncbi:MAG: methyltransferase [Myxococcota bacterium]